MKICILIVKQCGGDDWNLFKCNKTAYILFLISDCIIFIISTFFKIIFKKFSIKYIIHYK